jgi:hypothetical protein
MNYDHIRAGLAKRISIVLITVLGLMFAGHGYAAPKGDGCNFNAIFKIPEQAGTILQKRQGNNGKGNGGEAAIVYFELSAGEVVHVECVSTPEENPVGPVSMFVLLLNGMPTGVVLPLLEVDPNVSQ